MRRASPPVQLHPSAEHQIETHCPAPGTTQGKFCSPGQQECKDSSQLRDSQQIQEFLLGLSPHLGFLFHKVQLVGKNWASRT